MNKAGESSRLVVANPIFLVPDERSQIQHQGAIPVRGGFGVVSARLEWCVCVCVIYIYIALHCEASSRVMSYTRGTAFLVEGQGIGEETI